MADEHTSWLKSALNIDVHSTLKKIEDAGASVVRQVASPVAAIVAPAPPPPPAADAPAAPAASAPGVMSSISGAAKKAGGAVKGAASKALKAGNKAGEAIQKAESAAWDGTKKGYNAVTGVYDKVAPNFTEANKTLGKLVDAGEAAAIKGNQLGADQYAGVPVLGTVMKGSAIVGKATVQAAGGVVKGAGDLTAMAGNAVMHPIDATEALAKGALGAAEHVPLIPGMNTTVKGVHGLVDLARGKKDGEYGASVGELAKNLALNTKTDPKTGKTVNADVDFFADLGGGTEAWKEKPIEAAARTITVVAPMFAGDEGAGGKPTPEGKPPVPDAVDPLGKTQPVKAVDPLGKTQPGTAPVDPLGKTQPGTAVDPLGKTQVDPLGKTQPGAAVDDGPATEVDPPQPPTERAGPGDAPAQTPEQLRQNEIDAGRAHNAASQASTEATQEYVRYRVNKPNPARGVEGDLSKWDPTVDEALHDKMIRAQQDSVAALDRLEAARKATRDAAGKAKGKRGGGGFPPPKA